MTEEISAFCNLLHDLIFFAGSISALIHLNNKKKELRGLTPLANYTD
jgi:hypothetical protein